MKQVFLITCLVFSALTFSSNSFGDQTNSICEANPSAPQCVQARAKIPDSLPESYSLNYLIASANSFLEKRLMRKVHTESCHYVNSKHIAYSCTAVVQNNKPCLIDILQIWERSDYRVNCGGKILYRKLINPGPVPETMD